MAKNFKIADINRNARYTVTATDHDDGHAETREMTGADLVSFTNAAAHLYDIHAEEIAEPQEAQDTAEIMQQAGAVTLPQRVARKFCGWFGGATAQQSAGYWLSESAGLIREAVTIVYAACTAAQLREHLPDVLTLAQQIKAEMQQEALSCEIGSTLYII